MRVNHDCWCKPYCLPPSTWLMQLQCQESQEFQLGRTNEGRALHCLLLHCTALHCTALHCTAVQCTSLYCSKLHRTALHWTELHCTELHYTVLHWTVLHCPALLYTVKYGREVILTFPLLSAQNSFLERAFYYKHGFLLLFLHNSHGTKEFPDCGNLVRPAWVGNLRWDNAEPYEPFRWVNTEPSVQFRKANTDPSVQFRKANTDPSMQFRWGHREFLFC